MLAGHTYKAIGARSSVRIGARAGPRPRGMVRWRMRVFGVLEHPGGRIQVRGAVWDLAGGHAAWLRLGVGVGFGVLS